jgi:hypothetical protein
MSNFNRYELFARGLFIEVMTDPVRLRELIYKLRPISTQYELIRIGAENDGGYLLPDDLEEISVCFSPGVDVNSSFEADLLLKKSIKSHLADFSVEGPPLGFQPQSFLKKYIGAFDNDQFITLDTWVRGQTEYDSAGDFLLQMDIEGGEYVSILAASNEVLNRFRIISLEVHDIESWGDPAFFRVVGDFFDKLLQNFHVVHVHPNNCCGIVNLNGVELPRVFELTFLRKDRADFLGFRRDFPHSLDRPNMEDRPDLPLPEGWFQQN